jgi:Uma2 family endonuclease
MRHGTAVPVSEYLSTDYTPDVDYVDGELLDRNLGERDHSQLQMRLSAYLFNRRTQWRIHVYPGQRVQISPTRYRVPDICVMIGSEPEEQIFTKPPFICIEILSPDDRMSRMQRKIDDFLNFGVAYVWVLDPELREARVYTSTAVREVKDGLLRTENPEIVVPLNEIFPG